MTEETPTGEPITPSPKPSETNPPADSKVFTQEQVSKIVAKELEPFKKMKTDYDKLLLEQQKQKDAELTDTQRLTKENESLLGYKAKYEELSTFQKELLNEKLADIPETLKHRIPEGLSEQALYKWLIKNPDLFGTQSHISLPPAGGGGKPSLGQQNQDLAEAEKIVREQLKARGVHNPSKEQIERGIESYLATKKRLSEQFSSRERSIQSVS